MQVIDRETSALIARRVRAQAWRCWRNAAMGVSHLGLEAFYVEGWVVTDTRDPFVIEHGWCETDGRIIDPSYTPRVSPYEPPVAYFAGARFNAKEAEAALSRAKLPMAWSRESSDYQLAFEAAWREAAKRRANVPESRTRVVHFRREPCDVVIARPSKWACPFHIGLDGSRREILEKYRRWLIRQPALLRDVWTLRGKVLGCNCAPLPCHGDVLAELANLGDTEAAEVSQSDYAE